MFYKMLSPPHYLPRLCENRLTVTDCIIKLTYHLDLLEQLYRLSSLKQNQKKMETSHTQNKMMIPGVPKE